MAGTLSRLENPGARKGALEGQRKEGEDCPRGEGCQSGGLGPYISGCHSIG